MAEKIKLSKRQFFSFFLIICLSVLVFIPQNIYSQELNSAQNSSLQQRIEKLEQILLEIEKKQKAQEVMSDLQQTDEEKKEKDEDILDAAGREYTLATPGIINISYGLSYKADTYDQLTQVENEDGDKSTKVKHVNSHELSNSLSLKIPILKNLTFSASIPYDLRYSDSGEGSKKGYNVGDPNFNIQFQPFRPREGVPSTILNAGVIVPIGTNPYDLKDDDELATGSGYYTVFAGANFSKSIDPVIAFGGISFYRNLETDDAKYNSDKEQMEKDGIYIYKVDPGDQISANIGMGYSLSYLVSISIGFSYSYSYETDYYWKTIGKNSSDSSYSSSLSIGTNWKVSHRRSVNTSLNLGLFNSNTDVSFSLSLPFDFKL
jgi:hypothetical protein